MSRFISIDFETTGLFPDHGDEIIEIGATKFTFDNAAVDEFVTLCKPKRKIREKATKINGIKNEDVEHAGSPWEEWNKFLSWAGEFDYLVAHNASFEMKFLNSLYAKNQVELPKFMFIDTLALARKRIYDRPSYKLIDLANHLNIHIENPHRALDDSRATARLCLLVIETYKNKNTAIKNNAVLITPSAMKDDEDPELLKRLEAVIEKRQKILDGYESLSQDMNELQAEKYSDNDSSLKLLAFICFAIIVIYFFANL